MTQTSSVYANNQDSPFHSRCKTIIERIIRGKFKAAVSIQNLIELYAVITDKRRVEHPLTPIKARKLINFYKDMENIQLIFPTTHTIETLTGLIAKHKPKSQSVFDYLLVATMMDNDIYEIYTANSKHFKPFNSIKVINPIKD